MIKNGDKVICIKDAYYVEKPTGMKELLYKCGEIYEINYIAINDSHIYFNGSSYIFISRNDKDASTGFYLDNKIEKWYKFSDYFITLAEWREKQINSILDEND